MIQGTFVCQCRYGFIGDGHTCEPAPIYEGNDVIVSIGYALLKLNLDSKIGMCWNFDSWFDKNLWNGFD